MPSLQNWKVYLRDALILLLIFLALRWYMQGDVEKTRMPDVVVQDVAEQSWALNAASDQPYVVHLWGSWCPICMAEKDTIESLAQDYVVIKVAVNSGNDGELIQFAQKEAIASPGLVNDPEGKLMQQLKVPAVPATFFVFANGQIFTQEIGWTSEWGMRLRLLLMGLLQ